MASALPRDEPGGAAVRLTRRSLATAGSGRRYGRAAPGRYSAWLAREAAPPSPFTRETAGMVKPFLVQCCVGSEPGQYSTAPPIFCYAQRSYWSTIFFVASHALDSASSAVVTMHVAFITMIISIQPLPQYHLLCYGHSILLLLTNRRSAGSTHGAGPLTGQVVGMSEMVYSKHSG